MSLPWFCLVFAVSLPCLVLCCGRGLRPFAMTCPAVSVLQCHCCVFAVPLLCLALFLQCRGRGLACLCLVFAVSLPCFCFVCAVLRQNLCRGFAVCCRVMEVTSPSFLPLARRAHCHGYAPDWQCQLAIYVFNIPRAPRSATKDQAWAVKRKAQHEHETRRAKRRQMHRNATANTWHAGARSGNTQNNYLIASPLRRAVQRLPNHQARTTHQLIATSPRKSVAC